MPKSFLLDTNAYFILFKRPKPSSYSRLTQKIGIGDELIFYISEITSMEIHSVLGKYRRGSPPQRQACNREIVDGSNIVKCSNTWFFRRRKKLSRKVFRDFQKLIFDIESKKGKIKATILKLDHSSISNGRHLLIKYSDHYNFGSHDALIGGNLISAREESGIDLTLVTSDRGIKAVFQEENLPFYDPQIP